MPCDSLIQTDVVFGPSTDPDSMLAGLNALGLSAVKSGYYIYFNGGVYNTKNHTLTLEGTGVEQRSKDIKRSYMGQATRAQAKKNGWQIKEGKDQFNFQIMKRTM